MGRWSWLALGVGAYLAFTVARFPAGTALRFVAPAEFMAANVEGTLWSGVAENGSVQSFRIDQLRWQLRPWSLVLGRIAASVEARIPDGFVSGEVTASSSRVSVRNLRGAMSLPALAGLLPLSGIRGQASLALESLEFEAGWPANAVGELKLAGLEAAPFFPTGNSAWLVLGDYTVTFTPAPEGELAARFVDNGGPLEVSGTVTVDAARAYTFDALVKPRAGAAEPLIEGLRIMTAEPDAEGRHRLTLTGSL